MKRFTFAWSERLNRRPSPAFVCLVAVLIILNIYLKEKIRSSSSEIRVIEALASAESSVPPEFAQKIELTEHGCPSAKAGNPDSPLKIKYFYSLSCPYCVDQNSVIDELLPKMGNFFFVEWYSIFDCQKEVEKYDVTGVPTFVFTTAGVERPAAYGYVSNEEFESFVCRVSGGC